MKNNLSTSGDVVGGLLMLGAGIAGLAIDHMLKKNKEKKQIQIEQPYKEWENGLQNRLIQTPQIQSNSNDKVKNDNLCKDKEKNEINSSEYSRELVRQLARAIFNDGQDK